MIAKHNLETGEVIVRELNEQELADQEKLRQEAEAQAELETAKEAARQALLDKLGITAEEAKLLLG